MKHNITELIGAIKATEGEDFQYDEQAIQKELAGQDSAYSGIIIKVLSGVGGVLATLALLAFLLIGGIYESAGGMFTVGMLFIVGAVFMSRMVNMVFLDTVCITLYITGFILAGAAAAIAHYPVTYILGLFMIIALAGALISRGFMMVLLSVLVFIGCLFSWCPAVHIYGFQQQVPLMLVGLGLCFFTIYEAGILSGSRLFNRLYKPLQAGFFLSFLLGLVFVGQGDILGWIFWPGSPILSAGIILIIIFLLYRILDKLAISTWWHKAGIYLLALAICVPVVHAPGIPGALLLLLLSFYHGYKTEAGLSIAALVYFIVKYYYDLQLSLLHKSALLFFPGLVLVLVWYYFNKQLKKDEQI